MHIPSTSQPPSNSKIGVGTTISRSTTVHLNHGTFFDDLFSIEVNRTDLLKMYLVGMQLMFDLLCDLPALENLRLIRGIADAHGSTSAPLK